MSSGARVESLTRAGPDTMSVSVSLDIFFAATQLALGVGTVECKPGINLERQVQRRLMSLQVL